METEIETLKGLLKEHNKRLKKQNQGQKQVFALSHARRNKVPWKVLLDPDKSHNDIMSRPGTIPFPFY